MSEAGHCDRDPLVTDHGDFTELEAEVEAARADARAAGLLEERTFDA